MRRSPIAVVAIALASVALAGCGGAAGLGGDATRPVAPTTARKPAPAVSVASLGGGDRVTLAAHRGVPVILNFWASWCEPCQRETPALVAFSKAHPGLDVVGIAVNDQLSDSRRFAKKMAIPYELGSDPRGDAASSFGVTGLPTTVIIDDKGLVADTFFGEISPKQLEGYATQFGL